MEEISPEWGYFERHRRGGAADVVLVDRTLGDHTTVRATRAWSVTVEVPRSRFPDAASLSKFQDVLCRDLAHTGACAARIDGPTSICFYFYCDKSIDQSDVGEANGIVEYATRVQANCDPGWDAYFKHLLPQSQAEQMQLDNGKVLAELRRQNDRSDQPHVLNHWIFVRTDGDAAKCAAMLAPYGIALAQRRPATNPPFTLMIRLDQKVPNLSLRVANEAVLNFTALAARVGGHYDGWQTTVVV